MKELTEFVSSLQTVVSLADLKKNAAYQPYYPKRLSDLLIDVNDKLSLYKQISDDVREINAALEQLRNME